MKNIFIQFSIAALIVLLFGCSTSSDGNGNSNTSLPGPNITDIDGNVYQSVIICSQTCTKSNLNVSKYTDGTPIPQVSDPTQWANLTTGAWCYYNNSTANGTTYGKLYNWYAVAGIYDSASLSNSALRRKIAPNGWHVPTKAEWTELTDCLGGQGVAGGKMKASGTIQSASGLWQNPNTDATNESGFSGLPAGNCGLDGSFGFIGSYGYYWIASEYDTVLASHCSLGYVDGLAETSNFFKKCGFSVRCLKD